VPALLIQQPLLIRALRANLCWLLSFACLRESSHLNPLVPRAHALDDIAFAFTGTGIVDALEANSRLHRVPAPRSGAALRRSTRGERRRCQTCESRAAATGLFLGLVPQPEPERFTQPATWRDYRGEYRDEAGQLGAFSVRLASGALEFEALGGQRHPLPGDLSGIFWRDERGRVTHFVTRIGVARRSAQQFPGE
jgi:hypothetical protein